MCGHDVRARIETYVSERYEQPPLPQLAAVSAPAKAWLTIEEENGGSQ
jgi:hypothetical protein